MLTENGFAVSVACQAVGLSEQLLLIVRRPRTKRDSRGDPGRGGRALGVRGVLGCEGADWGVHRGGVPEKEDPFSVWVSHTSGV